MKITTQLLRDHRACSEQVDLFLANFPAGESEVTEELCLSLAQVFDWGWAGDGLLSFQAREAYDEATHPARRAYHEATSPARHAYDTTLRAARRAYDTELYPDWPALDEATSSAWRLFLEAMHPARRAHNEAKSVAFARAWAMDNPTD
jgi:hypothetical protein